MRYTVDIAKEAEVDLREIYEYIAYILQSPQNAVAQLFRLEKCIYSLETMPERYHRYEKEPWHSRGWRLMSVDHYCVFYMITHERKTVNITRVLYGGRDLEATLTDGV